MRKPTAWVVEVAIGWMDSVCKGPFTTLEAAEAYQKEHGGEIHRVFAP